LALSWCRSFFDSGSEVPDQGSAEVQFLIRDLKFGVKDVGVMLNGFKV